MIQEWNTLNIVSVLLLGALITALQLEGAAVDPLTRFSALISMICALMSLMYGCMYIIRFSTMRKTYKAAEWANEIKTKKPGIWWNVWILLALPAVWLAWAIMLYIVCIMCYVWRTGTDIDSTREPFSAKQALAPRIVVSIVLFLGIINLIQVITTLRGYGEKMDRKWQTRLQSWLEELYPQPVTVLHMDLEPVDTQNSGALGVGINPDHPDDGDKKPAASLGDSIPAISNPHMMSGMVDSAAGMSNKPQEELDPVKVTKLMSLTDSEGQPVFEAVTTPTQDSLQGCMDNVDDWEQLRNDVRASWSSSSSQLLKSCIMKWNGTYFLSRGGQIQACEEWTVERPEVESYSLYHFDSTSEFVGSDPKRYKGVPEQLERLDVCDFIRISFSRGDRDEWLVIKFGLMPEGN